jgi:hypothetical protein
MNNDDILRARALAANAKSSAEAAEQNLHAVYWLHELKGDEASYRAWALQATTRAHLKAAARAINECLAAMARFDEPSAVETDRALAAMPSGDLEEMLQNEVRAP